MAGSGTKRIILFILLTASLSWFLYRCHSFNPYSLPTNSSDRLPKYGGSNNNQKINSAGVAMQVLENMQSRKAEAHEKQIDQETSSYRGVLQQDLNGRESVIDAPQISTAQIMLRERAAIDPDKDFDSLTTPDFSDQQTGMFTGTFEDRETHIQLRFSYDFGTPILSKTTCVVTKESGPITQKDNAIQLKDDRAGYAGVMVNSRWYLKLTYTFLPKRTLFGKLYERRDSQWSFLYDFSAKETQNLKTECAEISK